MTGEEMERAIEFLLKSQATLDAQIERTNRQLETYAETQSEFIRATTASITGLAAAQTRTDAKLDRLIGLFEQHIVAAH
jgi:prefoldin subunit 5